MPPVQKVARKDEASISDGLFHPGDSVIHRLNPATKLTVALSFALTSFICTRVWLPLALVAASLVLLSLGQALRKAGDIIVKYLLFMLVILFVVQSFWYSGGASPIWPVGPFNIKIYGFLFASMITLRLLVVLCTFYLMMFTTHPSDLVFNLERRGLPPKIAYVMLATLQSIGEMQERANVIMDVQRCRGVEMEGGLLTRTRAYFPLIGPLIIGSILTVESRALALEVRGFSSGSTRTYLREIHEASWERWARYLLAALPLAALIVRLVWRAL